MATFNGIKLLIMPNKITNFRLNWVRVSLLSGILSLFLLVGWGANSSFAASPGEIRSTLNLDIAVVVMDTALTQIPYRMEADPEDCPQDSIDFYSDSAIAIHPSVVYAPAGWPHLTDSVYNLAGEKTWIEPHKLWLAFTPYNTPFPNWCNVERSEVPNLVAGGDGSSWSFQVGVNPGDTVQAPLHYLEEFDLDRMYWFATANDTIPSDTGDASTALAEYSSGQGVGVNHLADVELFFDKDGNLWYVINAKYIPTCDADSCGETIIAKSITTIWASKSTDGGMNWGDLTKIVPGAYNISEGGGARLSPAVWMSSSGTYSMLTNSMKSGDTTYLLRSTQNIESLWPIKDTVIIPYPISQSTGDTAAVWHFDIIPRGEFELLMVAAARKKGTSENNYIWLGQSFDDGLTWYMADEPILRWESGNTADSQFYRPTGYWLDQERQDILRLYVPKLGNIGSSEVKYWHLYKTDLYFDLSYFACGDANQDLSVNVGDAVYMINYIFKGGPPPNPLEAGDVNCDTIGDVGDAVYLVNFVFRSGKEPCANCR